MVQQNADISALLQSLKNSAKGRAPTDNSQNERIALSDYQTNATRRAPNLSQRLELIASGQPKPPSGAFGTIGKAFVENPITKVALSGLNTLGYPRRAVQSAVLELKDALDSNEQTVASASDWYSNFKNPAFGGGDLWKGDGWAHRIVGFGLDVLLDPLVPATLGGTIGPKQFLSAAGVKLAGREAGEQITARAFIGRKYIGGADGRNALARAVGKLGGSDDVVGAIAAEGRRAVPDEFVQLLGLQDYGIYYFGSRLRVPFSGTMGKMLAGGLTRARLGIMRSAKGGAMADIITRTGTGKTFNVKDLRSGLARGTLKGKSKRALALLNADESERGVRNLANREGEAFLKLNAFNEGAIRENQDNIFEFLDVPEQYWTHPPSLSQREAIKLHNEKIAPWFIDKANAAGVDVGSKVDPRAVWFPHKMSRVATEFVSKEKDPRVASILKWIKIDHTNLEGSFTARQFQNAAIHAIDNGEEVDWFGHKLTKLDLAGGIKVLNEYAKSGGFKGDFFETNYYKAMVSYLDDFSTHIGRQEFARSLANEGENIGEWAVQRGIITQDALHSVLSAPEKYKKHLSISLANVEKEVDNIRAYVTTKMTPIREATRKASGLSKAEKDAVAAGLEDAVEIGGPARLAGQAARLKAVETTKATYEQALSNMKDLREKLATQTNKFFSSFKDDTLALSVVRGNLAEANYNIEQYERQLDNVINILNGTDEQSNVFASLSQTINNDLNESLKIIKENIRNSNKIIDANMQLPGLSLNFEKIITGIANPRPGLETELHDIAQYGRNFEFRKEYVDRTTLVGSAFSKAEEEAVQQIKGLGRNKINYLLKVTESADTQVGQPGYVLAKSLKGKEQTLAKIFNASEQINDWVKLRGMLNIGDITESSLIKLNSHEVLSILTKGMTSTETNNIADIRKAIAWIYIREQLLDPGFATRELRDGLALGNKSDIVQGMDKIRAHMLLNKIKLTEVARTRTRGSRWAVKNDAALPKQAAYIAAEKNRPIIEGALLRAQTDFNTIDSVTGRSGDAIIEEFGRHLDRMGITNLDDVVDTNGYKALQNTFSDLNDLYPNNNIEEVSFFFEGKMSEGGSVIEFQRRKQYKGGGGITGTEAGVSDLFETDVQTYADINNFLNSIFANKTLQGKVLGTNRVKGIDLAAYEIGENELVTTAIQRRIVELQSELNELDEVRNGITKGMNSQEAADMRLLDNGGIGQEISRLAYNVGVKYLKLENEYALSQIDELLRPLDQPLNATGQALVTKEIVGKFQANLHSHSRILTTAENAMKKVYEAVEKTPSNQNIKLLEEVRIAMQNSETRHAFETVFPSIVIQADLLRKAGIDGWLLGHTEYKNWLDDVVNFRMVDMEEAVSPSAMPSGGGGLLETGALIYSKNAREVEAQNFLVSQQQGTSDKFLRSQNLQKSQYMSDLMTTKSHTSRTTIIKNYIKEMKTELAKLQKTQRDVPSKTLSTGGKTVYSVNGEAMVSLGRGPKGSAIFGNALLDTDRASLIAKTIDDAEALLANGSRINGDLVDSYAIEGEVVKAAKGLAKQMGGKGAGSRKTALRLAAKSEDSLSHRSIGNLFKSATDTRSTSRRAVRELFSNLFGGSEYANPLLIGEAYALNKAARKGGVSLRIVRESEAFFGRSKAQIAESIEHIKTQFPSVTTADGERIAASRAYVARLQEKLTAYTEQIKREPKLMKLVVDAQNELDKLNGIALQRGGNLQRRISHQAIINAWKKQQSKVKFPTKFPVMDRGAYTPGQANMLHKWVNARRQLAQLESTDAHVIAVREEELKDFAQVLSSVNITQIQDELGNLRWGRRSADIIAIDNELQEAKAILNQAIINGDEATQQVITARMGEIQSRLGQAGHSGGVRTWTNDEMNLLRKDVASMGVIRQEMEGASSVSPDVFVMKSDGIAKNPNAWTTDYDKLLMRVEDENQAPLMFLVTDAKGLSVAYDVRKPYALTIEDSATLSAMDSELSKATTAVEVRQLTTMQREFRANLDADINMTPAERLARLKNSAMKQNDTVTILEPKTVREAYVNPAGETVNRVKPARLVPGTEYQPENVWVGIEGHAFEIYSEGIERKLKRTSDLTELGINPVQYYRLSDFDGFKIQQANNTIKYSDGTDFKFTDVEELALHADWTDPIFEQVQNQGTYFRRRMFLEERIKEANIRVENSKRILEGPGGDAPFGRSQPKVKGRLPQHKGGGVAAYGTVYDQRVNSHMMAVASADKLQNALTDLDTAAATFAARGESYRKVSWLYNYFDNEYNQIAMGVAPEHAIRKSGANPLVERYLRVEPGFKKVIDNPKGVQPVTALGRYLKPYQHPESRVNLLVPDAVKTVRKNNIELVWQQTPEAAEMRLAKKYRAIMQASEQDFSTDDTLLANIGNAAQALQTAKNNVGATSTQLGEELTEALYKQGIFINAKPATIVDKAGKEVQPLVPDLTPAIVGKGIKEFAKQTEEGIAAIPMLESRAMEPNLLQHRIAIIDDAFSKTNYLKEQQADFNFAMQHVTGTKRAALTMPGKLGWKKTSEALQAKQGELFKDYKKLQLNLQRKRDVTRGDFNKNRLQVANQEGVLARAQMAFDSSTVAVGVDDVLKAQHNLNAIEEVFQNLKTIRGMKINAENMPNVVKEVDTFLKHVQPLLKELGNPQIDKEIHDMGIRYANLYTEYIRSVANLDEMEHLAAMAKGLSFNISYLDKAGVARLGIDKKDVSPMFRGALNEEFLLGFNQGFVQLSKSFPNVGVHPEIQELVTNVHRLNDPAILKELNRFLGKYTQFFKAYATLTPGFHTRNGISNGFMLFAAGGKAKYLMEGLGLSRLFNEAIDRGYSVEQFIKTVPKEQQFYARGAIKASSQSGGGNTGELLASLYNGSRLLNNPATRASRKVGVGLETHSRFMLAYDGIRQGMDPNTAAARVRRYLIDYEDLSTLDKGLRQIIPFWMWTSRNLPMQVQNIWMNPRAYQLYTNLKRNLTDEDADNADVPDWLKEMGAFRLPFGQNLYATPDIGFNRIQSDVNMLQDPRRFLSNVNPLIRLPIELTGDRQLFSGKRFSKTPIEVTGGVGAAMQPLMEALGYGETGANGKKFVNDKAYYGFLNLLPPFGQAERLSPSTPTGQERGTTNQGLGYFGIPARVVTPQMRSGERARKQIEMQDALQNYLTVNKSKG